LSDLEQRRRRHVDADAEDYMHGGIAAWQRVERVFQDIERENQLILRAAGEGIYGVNAEGKTTFVNPAAERMLGWTAEELVGKAIHPIVHHSRHDGSHYPDEDCPIYAAFRDGAITMSMARYSGARTPRRSGLSTRRHQSATAARSSAP